MSAPTPVRSLASSVCRSCLRQVQSTPSRRAFTATASRNADSPDPALSGLGNLANSRYANNNRRRPGYNNNAPAPTSFNAALDAPAYQTDKFSQQMDADVEMKPHRLYVYATKHNTHLTFVQPPTPASKTASSGISSTNASAADQKKIIDVLLSLSTGNLGFRKAGRGSYDAAYQLAAFTLKQMKEKGMTHQMQRLEVVMRGFGAGREAVTKVLLGSEGAGVRDKITAVVDATRLKIGGTRSPRPRRLG